MEDKEPRPSWSWAPNMPKPVIFLLTMLVDAICAITWTVYWYAHVEEGLKGWDLFRETFINPSPAPNIATALALIQLNLEVLYMFLTMRRNAFEKQEAVDKAVAEATAKVKAETEAHIKAEVLEWYETHKDNLQEAPPPFSNNGNGANPG